MNDDEKVAEAIEGALNLFVYAPIALVLDTKPIGPDLAKRGRAQAANARAIGEFTVKAGIKKLEAAMADRDSGSTEPPTPEPAADGAQTEPEEPQEPDVAAAAELDDGAVPDKVAPVLALDDYDTLAASQIVKRLAALSDPELEAIRAHESTGRGRRTILNKIAQLQG